MTRISSSAHKAFALPSLCALLISAVALAGCSSMSSMASGQTSSRFLDERGWRQEYASTTASLTLPPGIRFPDGPISGGATTFEVGAGLGQAQCYWMYAWEKEWLTQRGKDANREEAALKVLENDVPGCEFMTAYLDEGGRALYGQYLQKAKLGDPSGFQQDVEANPFDLQTTGE